MVCFNVTTSDAFPVSSGVNQSYVLAPILFGIFFSMLLQYALGDYPEGVFDQTGSDGKLFNIARLHIATKPKLRRCSYAVDAVLTSQSEEGLQYVVYKLLYTCKEFGLTISFKKTEIMAPLPSAPVAHHVAGQSSQLKGPGARWPGEHALTAHPKTPSVMYTAWSPTACQKESSTKKCGRAPATLADRCCTIKRSANVTYRLLKSTQTPGRTSQKTPRCHHISFYKVYMIHFASKCK